MGGRRGGGLSSPHFPVRGGSGGRKGERRGPGGGCGRGCRALAPPSGRSRRVTERAECCGEGSDRKSGGMEGRAVLTPSSLFLAAAASPPASAAAGETSLCTCPGRKVRLGSRKHPSVFSPAPWSAVGHAFICRPAPELKQPDLRVKTRGKTPQKQHHKQGGKKAKVMRRLRLPPCGAAAALSPCSGSVCRPQPACTAQLLPRGILRGLGQSNSFRN